MSVRGRPQNAKNRRNCSKTKETFESILTKTLLPVNKAARACRAGISKGKLKGAIMQTGPYGQR